MRKKGKRITVYTVCLIITAVFFALFTARLVDWQLVRGDEYKRLASRSTALAVTTDAVRGEILDKDGNGLVVNNPKYQIVIDRLYINENDLDDIILRLISLVEKSGGSRTDVSPIDFINAKYIFKDGAEDEKKRLFSDEVLGGEFSAEECAEKLRERYRLSENYSPQELINLESVRLNMEFEDFSASKPYIFSDGIGRSTVDVVSENTQGISGVAVRTVFERSAVKPELAPHILGALGALTEEELDRLEKDGKEYALSDKIGKFGIELALEDELKGIGGKKLIKRNSDGAVVDTVETIDSKPGNTVFLTLDSKLQAVAAESLAENVEAAKQSGIAGRAQTGAENLGEDCETGAAVMLSVKDFSVLAAASYPSYDLNRYSEYGDYYVELSEDKASPMFNRAFSGSFACGSLFKPCVACAALEEKIITLHTEIFCKQNYDYYPTNIVRCMHYHGEMNVTEAIEQSCNYFFAETGRRLGIEPMYLYAEKFGLGEYTGLEVEESRGTLAGRDSDEWQAGNTVQAAIGQSDNAFTPVQLATYAATLANNGVRLKTHIVQKVTDYERKNVVSDYASPEKVDECPVSPENMAVVQNAMLEVATGANGTASGVFGDYKVRIAAKTGTAENSGSDHTTFMCYAPYENPEVAIAVVIEHGASGRYSMAVAKDLLDAYFSDKEDSTN